MRRAFFIFWLEVLAILLPVLLSDCINVTAKKSQGVHVHASMRNQTAVVMLLFFCKNIRNSTRHSIKFQSFYPHSCVYTYNIYSSFLFHVCKLKYCVFVRVCTNRILFNFRKSHYDKKSMFSFQKVQTSLWWWW